jgi:predicted phage baseplate assembly protein
VSAPLPVLEPWDADAQVKSAERKLPAFVPGWRITPKGPGAAIVQVYARFLKALADAINQSPDKNKLAFFDLLGLELLPAQAARAPVVFFPVQGMPDTRVPARTQVGANVAGQSGPLIFETESAIALVKGKLAQVVSLWPGRDAWADHTAALTAAKSFQLFDALQPVPHVLYLAHDTLLALAGQSSIEVAFELARPGASALELEWEYWDGVIWRPFRTPAAPLNLGAAGVRDGTAGLTRSGTVVLSTGCGSSAKTAVNGIIACWLRAKLARPLQSTAGAPLPVVEQIKLRAVVDRPLTPASWLSGGGIVPEQAYADDTKLDLTKTVKPLGARPQIGSALYLAYEEAMSKPGAKVTLRYRRVKTPEEIADQQGVDFDQDAEAAQDIVLRAVRQAGLGLLNAADALTQLGVNLNVGLVVQITNARTALTNALQPGVLPRRMDKIADVDAAALTLRNLLLAVAVGLKLPDGSIWNFLLPLFGLPPLVDIPGALTANQNRITTAGTEIKNVAANLRNILDQLEDLTPFSAALAAGGQLPSMDPPQVVWEYWNGRRWTSIQASAPPTAPRSLTFEEATAEISFNVPDDAEVSEYTGVKARWIRARLIAGGYGLVRTVSWKDETTQKLNFFPIVEIRPPHIELLRAGYTWRSRALPPERCLAENDFAFMDQTEAAALVGTSFEPFTAVADLTPTLYLGFDAPLPADRLSLYLDLVEVLGDTDGPALEWDAWDGTQWVPVRVQDDTRNLAVPGMLGVPWPGAASGANPLLSRFGTPLAWLRGRRASDGAPRRTVVRGLWANAAWAAQLRTFDGETLGTGRGEAQQALFARNLPVLETEVLEVRELSGARARVEEDVLRQELLSKGVPPGDFRVVKDSRTGFTNEVWVRWRSAGSLLANAPTGRVYELERTRGRFRFDADQTGVVLPAGTDNVRLATYRSGGGKVGNLAREKLTQLLSGVLAERVTNPVPSEGGADGESLEFLRDRGGDTIRNRRQAITAGDYEELAREASPGVAAARALPTTHPSGRVAPGWVTVAIVPRSSDAMPWPSFELREQVRRFLAARAPRTIAGQIAVIPASYLPVGVEAVIVVKDSSTAGDVVASVRGALEEFLHPLSGGPDRKGWPFGRDVFVSDVAALLEASPGLDYVEALTLVEAGTPVGDRVRVPEDKLVVAGPITVRLSGGED